MSVPSAAEQLLLGTRPQQTEIHFDIFNPATVLSASVNDSDAAQGNRVITYDNATGDFNDVKPGMTLYVDNEFIRVISATSTTITVAENDYIVWTDDLEFVVRTFFLPWGVLPRITIDSNDIVTFFKDFNIEYVDQNSVLDPIVHMGPNAAELLDQDTGDVDIFYTSVGSSDPNGSGLSTFSWNFEGAQITGSSAVNPGNVTYDTPGDFITTLTVTNDAGKTFTSHRHIIIRNASRSQWGINSLEGNRGSGSWQASLWVRNDISDVVDGALVILHTTDFYGTTKQSIGGNATNRSNTLFVGYIYGESIRYDATDNIVTFTVFGLGAYLNNLETMSATLEDKATATTWNEMTSLDIDRALFGFIRWQTNIMEVADVTYTGNTFPVQFIDFARGPILASLRNLVTSAIKGLVNSDAQGALFIEEDIQTVAIASRNIPTTMELSRQFWMNEPEIQHRRRRVQSFLELGGILYSGATGTFAAMLSGAPGITPSYFGSASREHGLIIGATGQPFLNALTGNVFALRNNPFPEVTFEMAGNIRVFDIAPQEFTQATLSADETFSNVVWNPQRLIPLRVEYTYNPKTFSLLPVVSFEGETDGPPGETIIIPATPPWDPPELPQIPVQPIPVPIPPVAGNASHVFFMTDNDEIVLSGDIFSTLTSQPTWSALGIGSGLPSNLDALWDAGGGNRGWIAVIWDTSRAYVIGRVSTASPTDKPWAIWQTTNILDSSPVWVELLRGGDTVLGSTVFIDPGNGSPFSRLHRQGNSVYVLIRLASGGESHTRHDGAVFTDTAISIAQNVQTEVATEAAYTDESAGNTRVFNPIGTVLASFLNNAAVNRTIWRNYAGGSYFTFRSTPTGNFLHNANTDSDTVQFSGFDTSVNIFTEIRGALNGLSLCFVGGDDQAWVSANGSTFTTGTLVWEAGQIDFLDVGGGDQLAWLPFSVANSQEMFRLADDIFGTHAFFNKTGNYWTDIDTSGGAFLATQLQVTYE